ncbi:hypothetical protein DHD05_00180 [Arenibacter sp. N53]|uniref:hypothetical protein n=1 Tax=Arenibacter sp. N53 TaxID=2183746 RepID=UPI000CD3D498|nr:hypothetical protein [Arenibacter sp. N53]MCM4149994.1 hypothetical protein [Arenibacter sp. N53]
MSFHWADDGKYFSPKHENITDIPMALGLYRLHLEDGNIAYEIQGWGISMIRKKRVTYLVRFEMK